MVNKNAPPEADQLDDAGWEDEEEQSSPDQPIFVPPDASDEENLEKYRTLGKIEDRITTIEKGKSDYAEKKLGKDSKFEDLNKQDKVDHYEVEQNQIILPKILTDAFAEFLRKSNKDIDDKTIEKKKAKLHDIFATWEKAEKHEAGLESFFSDYLALYEIEDEKKRDAALDNFKKKFHERLGDEFSEEEVDQILEIARENRYIYQVLILNRKFAEAIKIDDGKYYTQAVSIILNNELKDDEKLRRLDGIFLVAARVQMDQTGDTALFDIIDAENHAKNQMQTVSAFERREGKQTAVRKEVTEKLALQNIELNVLENISDEGISALDELIDSGGTNLVTTMLSGEVENVSDGVSGYIEGERVTVKLSGDDVVCFLGEPGENIPILKTQPNAIGFDAARREKVARVAKAAILREPPFAYNKQFLLLLTGIDVRDEAYMTVEESLKLKNILRVLLMGKIESNQEIAALKELKILTPGGSPNIKYLKWFGQQLRLLAGDDLGRIDPKLITHKHLVALTNEWEKNGFQLLGIDAIRTLL